MKMTWTRNVITKPFEWGRDLREVMEKVEADHRFPPALSESELCFEGGILPMSQQPWPFWPWLLSTKFDGTCPSPTYSSCSVAVGIPLLSFRRKERRLWVRCVERVSSCGLAEVEREFRSWGLRCSRGDCRFCGWVLKSSFRLADVQLTVRD